MKILISGYYGFGNLGDDLLLISSFKIIKTFFPEAEIHILSNSNENQYIYDLTDEHVKIKGYKTLHHHYNLIIHGGGGIHFDYTQGGLHYLILNGLIKILGTSRSVSIINFFKNHFGSGQISCDKRIGIGIGFGPYTRSSRKYMRDICIIKDYSYLFVRDKSSINQLNKYQTNINVYESSDLIYFLDTITTASSDKRTISQRKRKICVILRDWKYDDNFYVRNILHNISYINKIYDFSYMALDSSDQYFINSVKNIEVYTPSRKGVTQVIDTIKNHDLIVTSRAHGAYLGSMLNVPSICINIEPKLKNVHDTLLNSSMLIPENITSDKFSKVIKSVFSDYNSFLSGSRTDLTIQKEKVSVILEYFKNYKHELYKSK